MPGWKQEEDDRLRDMAARGASAIRIAGALNRKIQLVRVRARFLGCPLPRISDQRRMLKQYDLIGRSDWGGQVWYPKTTQFRRYHSGGLP
jgi:hypothetical protein